MATGLHESPGPLRIKSPEISRRYRDSQPLSTLSGCMDRGALQRMQPAGGV
jgi:hypothetical protein